MAYFPMFINLKDKKCLVVGGGKVALRKLATLLDFDANVTVIAEELLSDIYQYKNVTILKRKYSLSDIEGFQMVIAATDSRELNHTIAVACAEKGIAVNVVDSPEDSSFLFPAYVKQGQIVAAFSSGGQGPVISQYMKKRYTESIPSILGEIAESMGCYRNRVKVQIKEEDLRKKVYSEIMHISICESRVLEEEEINRIITKYAREDVND